MTSKSASFGEGNSMSKDCPLAAHSGLKEGVPDSERNPFIEFKWPGVAID